MKRTDSGWFECVSQLGDGVVQAAGCRIRVDVDAMVQAQIDFQRRPTSSKRDFGVFFAYFNRQV
jgi:hypothetical protein